MKMNKQSDSINLDSGDLLSASISDFFLLQSTFLNIHIIFGPLFPPPPEDAMTPWINRRHNNDNQTHLWSIGLIFRVFQESPACSSFSFHVFFVPLQITDSVQKWVKHAIEQMCSVDERFIYFFNFFKCTPEYLMVCWCQRASVGDQSFSLQRWAQTVTSPLSFSEDDFFFFKTDTENRIVRDYG